MTPRLYTPPLAHHCTGPAVDKGLHPKHDLYGVPLECPCGCGLNPETSWGFSCNRFAREVLGRKLLPYQQWLNIHSLEKNDVDGGFRFKILVILISRQQGKTFWLQQLGLWRLFLSRYGRQDRDCPGAKLALIAAQNLQYAEGVLKEVVDEIRDNYALSQELINHRVTNGNHRAILTNRRYWRAATASRKGGRSLSVDIAMLDELREHTTTDAYDAIAPTTLVRAYSQIVCTSNAGDKRSEVLRGLRDGALKLIMTRETEDTKTGLFEWSVPDDVDPRDETYWHLANPALGQLNNFTMSDLRAMFEAQQYRNMPGFMTEHLALDVATPILTTGGWKTMETIEVGDQVYHPDGHSINVARVTPIYTNRPCYEVETTDGRTVICDADHRWMVQDRRRCGGAKAPFWETVNTQELLTRGVSRNKSGGGKFAYRLPDQHAIVSKPVELPIDPYLLGAWLGDGNSCKAEICAGNEDAADIINQLHRVGALGSVKQHERGHWLLGIDIGERLRDGFQARANKLGVWKNKHIPDIYLTAGTEQRLALLQGLMDTDGSIDAKSGCVRFCSIRKALAEQVLYLARSLGWRATIRTGVSQYGGKVCGPAYWVGWTHDASESPPFRLQRKLALIHSRPSRAGERTAISIRSITPVATRPVRCITVDSEDSLFLAGRDLLSTANCMWVDAIEPGIIPAVHWADTIDKESRRKDVNTPLYAGLDVNYERSRSFIAIASRRADKNLHIEVINGARGTDWVIPWLQERKKMFKGVAVQAVGAPVSGMIEDLRKAGIPVVEWGPGKEVAGGSGEFYDGICEHKIFHRPAPVLDRAAAAGVPRNVGEGWVFDRRHSLVDVSPIIACVAATWLEHRGPAAPPMIHSWPDEDTLQQWEDAADEKFPPPPPGTPGRSKLDDIEGTMWWTQ